MQRQNNQIDGTKQTTRLAQTRGNLDFTSRNTNRTATTSRNSQDEELSLLASLGSSVAKADAYEQDVLRNAELQSTPRVTGLGFPDLALLGPSSGSVLDVPHARTVLTKVRSELAKHRKQQQQQKQNQSSVVEPEPTRLYLKEQMLLAFLQQRVAQEDFTFIHPQDEAKQEERRRRQTVAFLNQHASKKRKSNTDSSSVDPLHDMLTATTKRQKRKHDSLGTTDDSNTTNTQNRQLTAGERLERIKSNGGRKSVSFAGVDEQSSAFKNRITGTMLRPRKSIMKHKQRYLSSMSEEKEDPAVTKQKTRLKELRMEREQRARARRKRWTNVADENDEKNSDMGELEMEGLLVNETTVEGAESKLQPSNDDESNSAKDTDNTNGEANVEVSKDEPLSDKPSKQSTNVEGQSQSTEDNLTNVDATSLANTSDAETEESSQRFVECPLCSQQIMFPEERSADVDVDAFLSQHMQDCQTSTKRGLRRSTRTRTRRNYSEVADTLDDAERESRNRSNKKVGNPQKATSQSSDVSPKVEIRTNPTRQTRKRALKASDEPTLDGEPMSTIEQTKNSEIDAVTESSRQCDDDERDENFSITDQGDDHEMEDEANMEDKQRNYLQNEVVNLSTRTRRKSRISMSIPPSLPPPKTKSLDDLDEQDYEDRVDDWIETGVRTMRDMKERDKTETPPGEEEYEGGLLVPAWINDRLFPYQRTGLQWMWELHRQEAGGIIGDEMGLGKTVQICGYLGSMVSSRKVKSVLIISPATMLQHWLKELAKWAPGLRRILIHQSGEVDGRSRTVTPRMLRDLDKWLKRSRTHRLFEAIDEEDLETRDPASFCGTGYVFVTTYENVRRSPDIWTNHNWSYVVMDEAQKIRNPDADVTLACKRLRTPHRLALSGTPIQNDLKELWSLFDFVFPGRLGTLPAFENEFSVPIRRGGYSNASPMQVQVAYRCAVVLRDLINPYLLRRQKKDIKEVNRMPGKTEQVLFCRLSDRQRGLYETFLQSDQVKNVLKGSIQMLGAITMLRKICNHPDLVCSPDKAAFDAFAQNGHVDDALLGEDIDEDEGSMSEDEELVERSGKLEILAKILPLWREQGHRVLIFCQWKKMLNIIQRFTALQGWKFSRLDGNTSVASRQRLVDTFNEDKSYFGMLCTTRTGGVGLNLTGADRIILYDPDWNPQTDAQARERCWRFGQENEVTIYRLISAGTVEEKIYQRQIFKTALSNKVLQDPRQRRLFSYKDLKDLFTLKADAGSVISGGDGMTETGELAQGDGYVDPDEEPLRESSADDGKTLMTVLKSNGLAGVFDHHAVEGNSADKSASVREMEEKAKRIANEAVSALEQSVVDQDSFTPTWTGSNVTTVGRFGGGRSEAATGFVGGAFGGSESAGVSLSNGGTGRSSSSLLASLRQRNEDTKSSGEPAKSKDSTKKYKTLLLQIQDFVRRKMPTTDALLDEFSFVPNYDAAIFRRLLNSVAKVRDGRWRLKQT